jgi:hypothetical protein
MQVMVNGAHHDLTRVEADAALQSHAMGAAHFLRIVTERRLHGERRVTGPEGVILVGNGRPKERHNTVAQHLVHGAFIAMHRVHHGVQGGIRSCWAASGVQVADDPTSL